MSQKWIASVLALLLAVCALSVPAFAEETVSFTDSAGRTVSLPATIERIAVTGPLAQMTIFPLAPELFVGLATDFDGAAAPYYEDYLTMPVLGQLYGGRGEMNLEQLSAANPQVIIDVGEAKDGIAEDMDALQDQVGIPVVHIACYTDTAPETYRTLGALLGREAQGEALAVCIERILALGAATMEAVGDNKVAAVYLPGADTLSVVGKGSYHSEILDRMIDNVAVFESPSSRGTGDPIDMEQLMLLDPAYLLFAPDAMDEATLTSDPAWQTLTAVREGNYCEVPMGPYNWMGSPVSIQRYLSILWMGQLFYPEQCDYDLYTEVANYYKLFYNYDMTREAFDTLTAGRFAQ